MNSMYDLPKKPRETLQPILNQGQHSLSVTGGGLRLFAPSLFVAPLLGAAVEASVHKALGGLMVEVLPGAHQGRVVDQGVEELPVPTGPLGAGHFLFLLLLDQLDP